MHSVELPKPLTFEWDEGNQDKNTIKHRVVTVEIEQVFSDPLRYLINDILHSQKEQRYIIMGRTWSGRLLLVAFTVRGERIRAISARDMKLKERKFYEEKISSAKV